MTLQNEYQKRKIVKLKQGDMVKLADLLREHCNRVNGEAVYHEGWDDERIMKAMVGPCSINSVQSLRRALLGELPRPKRAPKAEELAHRIEALEQYVIKLAGHVEMLEQWAHKRPVDRFQMPGDKLKNDI